jgi:hypothetical protein
MQAAVAGLPVAAIVLCLAAPGAIGDRVIVKGGYLRRDANHVLLDPRLANWPGL